MKDDLSEFVQSRLDDSYFTEDTPGLYRKKWHPLFVYGTLKQGFSRHSVIEDCPYIGAGWTKADHFKMYRLVSNKGYPIALMNHGADKGAIHGEVYLVPPKTIRYLDFIESNGVQYSRTLRTIDINVEGKVSNTMVAWMYVGHPEHWAERINNKGVSPCDKLTRKKNSNFHYYTFMHKYLNESMFHL